MLRLIQYYVKNLGFVHIYDEICAHPCHQVLQKMIYLGHGQGYYQTYCFLQYHYISRSNGG